LKSLILDSTAEARCDLARRELQGSSGDESDMQNAETRQISHKTLYRIETVRVGDVIPQIGKRSSNGPPPAAYGGDGHPRGIISTGRVPEHCLSANASSLQTTNIVNLIQQSICLMESAHFADSSGRATSEVPALSAPRQSGFPKQCADRREKNSMIV
jgi:hypothetical protein